MKTFFTSDTHFGHANIIRYSGRPFLKEGDVVVDRNTQKEEWVNGVIKRQRAKEMDEELIRLWNEKISNEDEVYHLGDFCFGRGDVAIRILRMLNFKKLYFIWGNHDQGMKEVQAVYKLYPDLVNRLVFLGDMEQVSVQGQNILLCHYAMRVWDASHKGVWHLYGHSHGSLADDPNSLSFDIGIDCHKMVPLSFEEVKAVMEKKNYKPLDHHGKREEGGGVGLNKDDYAKAERFKKFQELKQEFQQK